jgi:hypothetical protein
MDNPLERQNKKQTNFLISKHRRPRVVGILEKKKRNARLFVSGKKDIAVQQRRKNAMEHQSLERRTGYKAVEE